MIALVNIKYVPGRFKKARSQTLAISIAGINCLELCLELPEKAGTKRITRYFNSWAKGLKEMGIADVIIKNGSLGKKRLLSMGFKEPDNGPMMSAKAGEIAFAASYKYDRVFLSTESADRRSIETFNKLCDKFRYIVLDTSASAERTFMEIGGRYGVSPSTIKKDRVVEADCALFLARPKGPTFLSASCVYFAPFDCGSLVFGGVPVRKINLSFPDNYRQEVPSGYNAMEILSWLFNIGRITPEDIRVESAETAF